MPQSFPGFNTPFPNFQTPQIQPFTPLITSSKNLSTHILRHDEVHPVISGNKIFKLWYFLEEALLSSHKTIITFGGAWSNHLAATAFCCKVAGIKLIGIIRGGKPRDLLPFVSKTEWNRFLYPETNIKSSVPILPLLYLKSNLVLML